MVFSSLLFLFTYLPVVLLIYYLSPLKWRNGVLLIFNLIFYGWGEPTYIILMVFTITADYVAGLLVARFKDQGRDRAARTAVAAALVLNLAILFFFKYWDLIAGTLRDFGLDVLPTLGLSLPIGISFYTFQTMTYPVDLYRGDAGVQRNLVNFGTFVTLFPQLIAGPILKYKELADQLMHREEGLGKFVSGVERFSVGLAKKVLLANAIGSMWDAFLAMSGAELTVVGAWLGLVAYAFQIYFDFSGYSDMAVGLGRMIGFEFMENFNYPYISKSVVEFWKRWHISLTNWFREYLYFPLGGSRCSRGKWIRNILIVWVLTGIWHGAGWNFLLWGLYFGVLLILEKLWLKKWIDRWPRALQHLYTLFLVLVSWAIFAVEDFGQLGGYLSAMFGFAGGGLADGAFRYYLGSYGLSLLAACVASTPLMAGLWRRLPGRAQRILLPAAALAGLLLCTAYLVDATYNPFLYFRF